MKVLYEEVLKGYFVDRPNRFIVHIKLEGKVIAAHLPNPGRMWELLYKDVIMYVVPHGGAHTKTKFRVVGIERDGVPIMLDTNYSNEVAEYLINKKQIPGWEQWHVIRREYTVGKSRFDLLLGRDDTDAVFLLEVKSCTLFSKKGSMFPDAITERGRKHLLHLKELQSEGYHTGVLFLVQWDRAEWFLPDYHTDIAFAQTFAEVADSLDWKAVALRWSDDFHMPEVVRVCHYVPQIVNKEAHDAGDYMMVMHLQEYLELEIGSQGVMNFVPGYYVYVGSAKANLAKRMERHKRKRKNVHWHLDYFRPYCEMIAAIPIRTQSDLECKLAKKMKKIADWEVLNFGCSDCDCSSHLFGMRENPVHNKSFMTLVEDFRMNRLNTLVTRYSKK